MLKATAAPQRNDTSALNVPIVFLSSKNFKIGDNFEGEEQAKGRRKSSHQGEIKKEKLRKILLDKLGIDNIKLLQLRSENTFDKDF